MNRFIGKEKKYRMLLFHKIFDFYFLSDNESKQAWHSRQRVKMRSPIIRTVLHRITVHHGIEIEKNYVRITEYINCLKKKKQKPEKEI